MGQFVSACRIPRASHFSPPVRTPLSFVPQIAMSTVVPPTDSPDCAGAPSPPVDLSVFLAYENLASALFATDTLAALSRRDPDGLIVQLSPWSFAALVDPLRRELATPNVGQAHLVVIAGGGAPAPLPAPMVEWLKSCLVQRGENRPAVVALFTRGAGSGRVESQRRHSVAHLAQETGCAFFAPGVPGSLPDSFDLPPCKRL